MKKHTPVTSLLIACIFTCLVVAAHPAMAVATSGGHGFGVGLELGHGAGLSLKYVASPSVAWQFGVSTSNYGRYRTYYKDHGRYYYGYDYGINSQSFLVHGEYLATQTDLLRGRLLVLGWYAGGGLDLGVGDGLAAGVHGNLGLAGRFTRVPLDVFVEWTPRLWVVDFVQLHPVDINAGVRLWF